MRVAFIEQDIGIGGAEVNLFYLFERAPREQLQPLVVVPYEGPLTERLSAIGVEYLVVRRRKLWSTSTYVWGRKIFNPFAVAYDVACFLPTIVRLASALRKRRIQVVHTNSMVAHIYGGVAARLAGVPCVWHMQDIVEPTLAFGLVRKDLVALGGVLPTGIVAVSRAVGDMFKGPSGIKVKIVYNGADTERFLPAVDGTKVRAELGIAAEELVIGMVGRLTQWKGQVPFLRAAALIAKQEPKARFLVVGGTTFSTQAYFDELLRLRAELGLEKRVVFTGFRSDIPELTAAMDVCVLPSILPDPCPLVMFDFGASGKPTVASNGGGVPEVVVDGETGLLVPPGDDAAIAEGVLRLLGNPPLRDKMGRNARQHIRKSFSVEAFVENMCNVYANLAQKGTLNH